MLLFAHRQQILKFVRAAIRPGIDQAGSLLNSLAQEIDDFVREEVAAQAADQNGIHRLFQLLFDVVIRMRDKEGLAIEKVGEGIELILAPGRDPDDLHVKTL